MPSSTVSPGRLQSAESGLRCASAPQSEDAAWRLPSGVILPPRKYLQKLGVLSPTGALLFEPQVVRGDNGPLCVVVGHLTCYFQSKGKNRAGEFCGRWLLTSLFPGKCGQWLIDETGDAYNIGAMTQAQPGGRTS